MKRKTRASREALRQRLALLREAERHAERDVDAKPDRCESGKRVFKKKAWADAEAKRLSVTHHAVYRRYHCRRCGHYHLTTKSAGQNPVTGEYEKPQRRGHVPTLSSLVGCRIVRMVRI